VEVVGEDERFGNEAMLLGVEPGSDAPGGCIVIINPKLVRIGKERER
jgi:hypothetical protein